jgi:hypothetical protein
LNNAVLGFDLFGWTTLEQAKTAVAFLNENVLNVFVTVKQNGAFPVQDISASVMERTDCPRTNCKCCCRELAREGELQRAAPELGCVQFTSASLPTRCGVLAGLVRLTIPSAQRFE